MAFNTFAPTGVAGFTFAGTAETFMIVESHSKGLSVASSDMGFAPATGVCNLYGNHNPEVTDWSLSGIALDVSALEVGDAITLANVNTVGSHAATTEVLESLQLTHDVSGGRFMRVEASGKGLPYAPASSS